ncbi:MAG: hypothetical protein IT372_42125 [Polyangiaceae bacterium]|nr:hypothetical protein [Polyangiaceae bacterium]
MSSDAVFIIHRVPGRVRLGIEAIRRDPEAAQRLASAAAAAPWVAAARASHWAASLVVEHDPDVPITRVLAALSRIPGLAACGRRLEDLSRPRVRPGAPGHPGRTAAAVLRVAERLNMASASMTSPGTDLRLIIPGALILAGIGAVLLGRGAQTPGWLTFIKYGFDSFVVLNARAIRSFAAGGAPDEPGGAPRAAGGGGAPS